MIFELLDANGDGALSLTEFSAAIETSAPVQSISQLRKRLVCIGYTSMMHAISAMDGGEDRIMQPLNLAEFGAALSRVWVIEEFEQAELFKLVRDPFDPVGRASLCDLACALAAVSPVLIFGDARQCLVSKFGSLAAAGDSLKDEWLTDPETFAEKGSEWLGMLPAEARKLFRVVDFNGVKKIDRNALFTALSLPTHSVLMEDLRRKVHQQYQSIEAALRGAVTQDDKGLNDTLRFSNAEILNILEDVDMVKAEKHHILTYITANRRSDITLREFWSGIRCFAPVCILEGLRMQLLSIHTSVIQAFRDVRRSRLPLQRSEMRTLLESRGLNLSCLDFDAIFDMLDVRCDGTVTVTELIAALVAAEPGTRTRVGNKELVEKVQRNVQDEFAPLQGSVTELKTGLRRGVRQTMKFDKHTQRPGDTDASLQMTHSKSESWLPALASSSASTGKAGNHNRSSPTAQMAKTLPRRTNDHDDDLAERNRMTMRGTFQKINSTLSAMPSEKDELKRKTLDSIGSYLLANQRVSGQHEALLEKHLSRFAHFRQVEELRRWEHPQPRVMQPSASAPQLRSLDNVRQ